MLNNEMFVEQFLNTNLFYLRTLRDFAINIALSFYENNNEYITRASNIARRIEEIGREIITSTNGIIPTNSKEYQIFYTQYTLEIEKLTERLFNINLATDITENELNLTTGTIENITDENINNLIEINNQILQITEEFIELANEIMEKQNNNELFSYSYPLLYDYMIRTTNIYQEELTRLNEKLQKDPILAINSEYEYNLVIYEILSFLRGLINPSEQNYIEQLDILLNDNYKELIELYNSTPLTPTNQKELTRKSIELIRSVRILLQNMLKDILDKKLNFIIEPLAIDNFYRTINYFLYNLNITTNNQFTKI